ncbi:MAG: hypothetical protein HY276_03465 [Ignavibacteriales bacterium]|nr:hypothetical protein [Ignavibacteriales bacterium]
MKFRILITKTLDVPKNVYHEVVNTEEAAKKLAQEKLLELGGDVAVITSIDHGQTKVIHRFEKVRKAG